MSDLIEIFPDGTQIERAFTEDEIKQRSIDADDELKKQQIENELKLKKDNALAKLTALGLEIEDLKVLGLG